MTKSSAQRLQAQITRTEELLDEIESKIRALQTKQRLQRAELEDFKTALRKVAQVDGLDIDIPPSRPPFAEKPGDNAPGGKPSHMPSTRVLIHRLLRQANAEGAEGLTQTEIVAKLRASGWDSCKPTDVSPVLVREIKQQKLSRTDGVYSLQR